MKLENRNKPIRDIHPKEWVSVLGNPHNLEFRNLQHFKNYVSGLSLKSSAFEEIAPYRECVKDLLAAKSQFDVDKYKSVRDLVRSNLLKRGLISENIYEGYKYDIDGIAVDVAKVIAEDPECMLTPNLKYKSYFYELYINMSYNAGVTNEQVLESLYKLLATVEELERQHIFIKITLIDATNNIDKEGNSYLMTLPLFSHKEVKNVAIMSSVINERFLRRFVFAICENEYEDNLASGYGTAVKVPNSIQPVNLDECELFTNIYDKVITPGVK